MFKYLVKQVFDKYFSTLEYEVCFVCLFEYEVCLNMKFTYLCVQIFEKPYLQLIS